MSTILTDDERPELPPTNTVPRDYFTTEQMEAYADAREAAVLAKLAQQEPVAGVVRCEFDDECDFCKSPQGGTFTRLIHNPEDVTEAEFYICGDCLHQAVTNYTHPAPQQADRQRVPAEPTEAMLIAARDWSLKKYGKAIGDDAAKGCFSAMLAAAPEAPAQASAVDERDRKDAERYRFIRDADRSDKLVPFDTLLSYASGSLDEAIDEAMELEARAALAQKGGAA